MSHQIPPRIVPSFLRLMAILSVLGTVALLVGNVWGSIAVPNHDWVADTVSDLAAGRYEIIQDVALYGFGGSMVALALAVAHLHPGGWQWSVLSVLLILIALCIVIIGARNEYGDGDSEGIVIHIYVVYAMGALYTAAFALAWVEGDKIGHGMGKASLICGLLWVCGAPIFFVMPTGYDGAWERGLGVICAVWTVLFARALWRSAQVQAEG
ncbi:DUF998 domain-containing protein [Sulfitobacter sp. S190]|uniref:DUF998 domain-containing protein n=1 Tax=Sulfitobacter sp. S190 TaxID=2867022 RepID=UPI0021A59A32|nr:DUF998 domain-containing protein [Sulfitobacter sp. S190]UWR23096.1 DUF998 domain-containing protein [Sulfitobacter sp. S190]